MCLAAPICRSPTPGVAIRGEKNKIILYNNNNKSRLPNNNKKAPLFLYW
jgi:hypothetical protein